MSGKFETDLLTLEQIEQETIEGRMRQFDGDNKPRVAKSLGICLKTLYVKLKRYRMRREFQRREQA